jgi:hypothetical protein
VPNSVSILGLISILFFIQVYTIAGYPRAQKRRLQSRSLDVTSEVEEQPAFAVSFRIVLRQIRWADNNSVKSLPRRRMLVNTGNLAAT